MSKKSGLGRGLSAILPDVEEVIESVENQSAVHEAKENTEPKDAVVSLPLGSIDPNKDQPRKHFDDEALNSLADSIRSNGVINPVLVARDGERYTLIAGERRWRASRLAGMDTIPAIIREWDDIRRQEAALIENIQRENLNPIEEAQGIRSLMDECAMTQEAIAERLGRSRPAVTNSLRLLTLPVKIRQALIEGKISAGHARVLAGIDDKERQNSLFEKTVKLGWSVRQLEAASKEPNEKKKHVIVPLPVEYDQLQERLRSATGLKVSMEGTAKKGKIVLQYSSQDELQKLWDLIGSEEE